MTSEDRKRLRDLQIKADFEDDIPSHGTRKDFEPARFANLRNGGNLPRAKPGRIRLRIGNAIGLACIIVIALVFYVVTP